MLCINSTSHQFSPRVLEYIALACNEWCSNNSKYYITVSGKGLFLRLQSRVLDSYGFKVGERVRVPSGVAVVAGEAYGRVWFLMAGLLGSNEDGTPPQNSPPRVWYYSNKQVRTLLFLLPLPFSYHTCFDDERTNRTAFHNYSYTYRSTLYSTY